MLNLLFRKGFPKAWMGQYKLFVFEIILNDGSKCEAVVDGTLNKDKNHRRLLRWKNPETKELIPSENVLGWRETYNCDAAMQDINAYFANPISIISKDYLGDAFARHINREGCVSCKSHYEKQLRPVS